MICFNLEDGIKISLVNCALVILIVIFTLMSIFAKISYLLYHLYYNCVKRLIYFNRWQYCSKRLARGQLEYSTIVGFTRPSIFY